MINFTTYVILLANTLTRCLYIISYARENEIFLQLPMNWGQNVSKNLSELCKSFLSNLLGANKMLNRA